MNARRRFAIAVAALGVLGVLGVLATAAALRLSPVGEPPSLRDVRATWCPSDVHVLDRHGATLQSVRVDASVRRLAWTPLADVSSALASAVLASEDRRFASHHGVDWRAVAGAAWQRVRTGRSRGASTVTMQLAALVDPARHGRPGSRSAWEKWRQMRTAWRLEQSWSKGEILEAYLNLVTFRGEVQGVHAAADAIFAKQPHGLSLAESAVLAASLRAPNATAGALRSRARTLLVALQAGVAASGSRDAGTAASISAVDEAVARTSRPPGSHAPGPALAGHAARRLLAGAAACRDVSSTLDARIQRLAETALRRHLLELRDRSVRDGAVLVVDNRSAEVLAYVGSSGDLSSASQVDGVRALRQAGSTLKPLLYAAAIERGLLTPGTLLEDTPLDLSLPGGAYRPANYDETFRGLVSVRTALASSLNVPAVRTLTLVGDVEFARTLRSLGLQSVARPGNFYGPSLALGSADVSLAELVAAYRALATGGTWDPISLDGAVEREARRVFRASTAFLVGDILSDREGRASTFGLENALATPFWSAVKTGTSKDMRDNWCVGYTSRFTVGVWVGNFSGEPMRDVSGVTGAAPVWEEVMSALDAYAPGEAPAAPADVVATWTSFANDAEPARRELYHRGSEPLAADRELEAIARISSPVDGSILAVDPDIAPARQRVSLSVHAPRSDLAWRLNGQALGGAATVFLWEPTRGRHELELVDGQGRRLDIARFEVKGAARR